MTEHTKGLLALFRNGQSVGSVDGYGVCELWPRSDEGFPNCEGKENGRRIVACWNLLDGYATEELEGVTLAEFVASHPELAEKLEAMTKQRDVLLDAMYAVQSVMNSSEGVAGWHKNGDIASWDKVLPEVADALEFVEGEQS
ncbi:hypothetical protein ACK38U_02330 [Aeromonas veronii]